MGLDPSSVPTAGDLASHTRSLLARAERQLDERRATLSHDARRALTRDLERIEDWFGSELSREGVRGVALFSAELDDFFLPLSLPWPVEDEARIARQLYLAPLVRWSDVETAPWWRTSGASAATSIGFAAVS